MLYLVPTPIGNLEDITFRAVEVLKQVDLILAEDTRVTRKLLNHYSIETKLSSFHSQNEHKVLKKITSWLETGKIIALVSDAGTPGISDPGYLLVRACLDQGIKLTCLPGPTAFVPALVMSGLPSHRFLFEGFLPHKKGRMSRLSELAELEYTFILYESPNRIVRCLQQLKDYCGANRQACLCRELSKLFEEVITGSLQELLDWSEAQEKIRGEFVIVVAGKT